MFDDEGRKWSKTVQASVRESHVSAPVMGVWWRLTQAELRNPSPPGKSPQIDGWLWLTYGSVWLHAFEEKQRFSDEPGFAYEASMDANELRVSTPIFMGSEQTAGGLRGWFVQNYQCAPDGPPATYSWSARRGRVLGKVKGKPTYARYIVLRARDEPCAARQQLMEGTWKNLGP